MVIQLLARYNLEGYNLGGCSPGSYSQPAAPISDLVKQLLARVLGGYSLGGYSEPGPPISDLVISTPARRIIRNPYSKAVQVIYVYIYISAEAF